jgi:hypothetical protein
VAIPAPLAVLAVVLLLGFAACEYTPPEPAKSSLTFRARAPTALTVDPPGVKFAWSRPSGGIAETAEVSEFEADDANDVNVDCPFELPVTVQDYVLLFEAEGSPLAPPFRVECRGLS